MAPQIPTRENSHVRRSNSTSGRFTQVSSSETGGARVTVSSSTPTLLGSQGPHTNENTRVTVRPSLHAVRRESRPPASDSEESHRSPPIVRALDIVTDPSRTDDLGGQDPTVVVFVNAADNVNGVGENQAETRSFDKTPSDANGPQSSRSSTQTPSPATSISRNSTSEEEDWYAERMADKRRELAKRNKSRNRRRVRSGSRSRSGTPDTEVWETDAEERDDETEPCDDDE